MRDLIAADAFDVLGIEPGRWAACLADSRVLSFEDWREVWVPARPDCIPAKVWDRTCRIVYAKGPLHYWLAVHVN